MTEELTKKLFDVLHELPIKKEELEQLQQLGHAESLSKKELLAESEGLKVEASNLRAQLDFTNKVLHKCEENMKRANDAAVKNKLSLEAMSHVSDKMKEEAIRLHSENMALKKQIEQLEKETKTESFFRESCILKQSKMQATIESLTNQMRELDKDFRDVERKSNRTLSVGKKSKLVIDNKDRIIKQLQEKVEDLSAQNIALTSEAKTLKLNENGNNPVEQRYVKEIMKEWQQSLTEMEKKIQISERYSETLQQTLDMALKGMEECRGFEESSNGKVRELEAKREERTMCTDCSVQTDLNMSIEVGCQTTGSDVDNAGSRTDLVDLQMKKKDNLATKPLNNGQDDVPTYSRSTSAFTPSLKEKDDLAMKPLNNGQDEVPTYSRSTSAFTPSLKCPSTAVMELMSKFQKERAKQDSEETKSQPF